MSRTELAEASFVIGLGVLGVVDSFRVSAEIKKVQQVKEILGADSYLLIVAAFLLVCGLLLLGFSRIEKKPGPETNASPGTGGYGLLGLIVAAYILYALAVPVLGYLLGSILFFAAIFFLFGARPWLKIALLGLGVALISNFLFVYLLNVPLPKGWFKLSL
jgi:hypothetical protein